MPKPTDPQNETAPQLDYVGRFAPSPTGPLHFGSLLAALASYLDARANSGKWLLRVEDLDPPREPAGSAELILEQLHDLGMHWDSDVLYQSSRLDAYAQILEQLGDAGLCYPCDCTRAQIRAMGNVYDGSCRDRISTPNKPYAIRLKADAIEIGFEDAIQGKFSQRLATDVGDYVLLRKDKLFAYQLAVVVDDAYQKITHVVRGWDLLDSTPRQIYLQQRLDLDQLHYAHIPIIVDELGQKLSKQAFAPSIETGKATDLLVQALQLLGQSPPEELKLESPNSLLQWAVLNWDVKSVPKVRSIAYDS